MVALLQIPHPFLVYINDIKDQISLYYRVAGKNGNTTTT